MTPFAQGYIEAMRASMSPDTRDDPLAEETLARIMEDCERFMEWNRLAQTRRTPEGRGANWGQAWWGERNQGLDMPAYPPQTPYLGDDGRVYLRESSQ